MASLEASKMIILGYKIIQLALAIWEILIGLQIVRFTMVSEIELRKKTKIVGVLFCTMMGTLLMYNRTWAIVSWSLIVFNIIVTFVFCSILMRKQFITLFAVIWAYYSIISILEMSIPG